MDSLRPPTLQRGRTRAPSKSIRATQDDQLSKLNAKSLEECAVLEEVRDFVKKRSALDREYAEQLTKLASTFLQKRKWPPAAKIPGNANKTSFQAWRSVLDETEKLGKQKLLVSELLANQISDPIKPKRAQKIVTTRKGIEYGHRLQEELYKTNQDTEKAKKVYFDLEKVAQLAREKHDELLKEQLGKKKTGFLSSKKDVEKKVKKAEGKRQLCERRSQAARHEYLLTMTATNAHVAHYYQSTLPDLMKTLDGDYFESLSSYLTSYADILKEEAAFNVQCGEDIASVARVVSRDYESQIFLLDQTVAFQQPSNLRFEPMNGDPVTTVVLDQHSAGPLNKEASKLQGVMVRNRRKTGEKEKTLAGLVSMSDVYTKQPEFATAEAQDQTLTKIDEVKDELRKLELSSVRAKARLDLLQAAGVEVDLAAIEDVGGRGGGADADDDAQSDTNSFKNLSVGGGGGGSSGSGDDENMRLVSRRASTVSPLSGQKQLTCVALYEYQATTEEELSIAEDEKLIIYEQDNDGWCRGVNSAGNVGLFPSSYVEITGGGSAGPGASHTIPEDDEFDDYPDEDERDGGGRGATSPPPPHEPDLAGSLDSNTLRASMRSNASAADDVASSPPARPVPAARNAASPPAGGGGGGGGSSSDVLRRVCALYDNDEAEEEDDLEFVAGDWINVIKMDENGDGFWFGRTDDGREGFFQSFLVDEGGDEDDDDDDDDEYMGTTL